MMQNKKEYYSDKKTVEDYYNYRYGGKSGDYVNNKELSIISSLLPKKGFLLDAPCGLGRSSVLFKGYKTVGFDYSSSMLKQAKGKYTKVLRGDICNMPFKNNTFDIVISLRFLFHYKNIEAYIKEFSRVLKKGGIAILETYSWSPLQFPLVYPKKTGGRVFIHKGKKFEKLLKKYDFEMLRKEKAFLFSPFVYRYLPFSVVKVLGRIENIFPSFVKPVIYWKVKKV